MPEIVPLRATYTGPMAARRLEPHRLDVAALAAQGERIQGELEPRTMPRWREMQSTPADVPRPPIRWEARGEQIQRSGEAPQSWLHLRVSAEAWPICQRCLQPFRTPIEIDRRFRVAELPVAENELLGSAHHRLHTEAAE